jgi:hypothetical protein
MTPPRRYNFRTCARSAVAPPLLVHLDAAPAPSGPRRPAAPAAGEAAARLRALTSPAKPPPGGGGGGGSPLR